MPRKKVTSTDQKTIPKKKVRLYDCLKKFVILDDFNNLIKVHRLRNTIKVIKVYENGKFKGYLKLDKFNRNLHIEKGENGENILFTDY